MKMVIMFDNGKSVEMDSVMSINVPKAGQAVEVDMAELPEVSVKWAIDYGWRQGLVDATASIDPKTDSDSQDKALSAVNKRLDNLKAGKIRASGGRVTDELVREALAIAAGDVRIALKKAGKKLDPNVIEEEGRSYADLS